MLRGLTIALTGIGGIGLLRALGIHVATFWGDHLGGVRPFFHMHIWAITVGAATILLFKLRGERPESLPMPRWLQILPFLYAAFQMVFLFALFDGASPREVNGQYELVDHGRLVRTLTEGEYNRVRSVELRLFSSAWVVSFFWETAALWHLQRNMRRGYREVRILPDRF